MRNATLLFLFALSYGIICPQAAPAADWYVGPKGTPAGKGTAQAPWDLESTLRGNQKAVQPGDTVYLLGGAYRRRPQEQFEVRLAGQKGQVIHVRPAPGQHAIIDGGLTVLDPSAHLWVWDLEILVSEPDTTKDKPSGPGSHPPDFTRPWGGLNIHRGQECKFINLVIHDCRQGISLWSGATDTEVHSCIIYDNGWTGTDRGHGHAIYTQNKDGRCLITDCLMTGGRAYSMHAYGSSKAYVDNYHIEGNIVWKAGQFLVGGGRPSNNIHVVRNYLHGVNMQLGYSAPHNENCEVRDNVIVNGSLTINRYKKVIKEDNLILRKGDKHPADPLIVLRPNKYDPNRAHLAIFNWNKQPTVPADLGKFLQPGDRYRLHDPRQLFGKPLHEGQYTGTPIPLPIADEFAAFVVLKQPKQGS